MNIEQVNPQLQSYAKKVPSFPLYRLWFLKLSRILFRFGLAKTECLDGISYSDKKLAQSTVRVYKPKGTPSGIGVLWIHGGGLITGSPNLDNKTCSRYVKELGAVVCSVKYRLAPEHPFPAGLNDCMEVWKWFQEQAVQMGVDPTRIVVAGQSAGGCMATSLAHKLMDIGGQQPAAQLLFCPMLDDRTAADTELDKIDHLVWNNRTNRAAWSWYLGGVTGSSSIPEGAVPARRENLRGLPPAWIGIGDIDLFYNENVDYAKRLENSGVMVEFDSVPMAPHTFENFADSTRFVDEYFKRHFESVRKLLSI
ncbi:alpha/beta hydrolase [Paraglaciecola sp. 20A4]|uniref:alpha/beta hydrolase n=1 Tax=Paraglaciecola sp. 20A4 TaxID=2687288 RepID=UPI00140AE4BB|nr:alpha/beta hydrolase [Paraglaciecola sp. 20A4]